MTRAPVSVSAIASGVSPPSSAERPTQPDGGLFRTFERVFGDGLDSQEADGAIGFFDGQRLPPLGPVAAGARGNDETLDFAFAQSGLGQTLQRRERKALAHRQREFGLRAHQPPEH